MGFEGSGAFFFLGGDTTTVFSTGEDDTTGGGITPPELDDVAVKSTSGVFLSKERPGASKDCGADFGAILRNFEPVGWR